MNRHVKKIFSIIKYPRKSVKNIINQIEKLDKSDYIVFYNEECIGITNATKELFKNTISLNELFNKKAISNIAKKVAQSNVKQVIFATMAYGYKALAEKIKEENRNIVIKFLWHGSHSLFVNRDEEYFFNSILDLEKRGIVTSIGFLKDSMAKYYNKKGYNSCFVMNRVSNLNTKKKKVDREKIKVGIYSAGDRWEKNTYNQLSACSLVDKDLIVDTIPMTPLFKSYSELMNIKYNENSNGTISRDELFERMSNNTLNLYTT